MTLQDARNLVEFASALRKRVKIASTPVSGSKILPGTQRHEMLLNGRVIGSLGTSPSVSGSDKVVHSRIDERFRGMGLGKKLYGEVLRKSPGGVLESDRAVSDKAARVYRSMSKRGYSVSESPAPGVRGDLGGEKVFRVQRGYPLGVGVPPRPRSENAVIAKRREEIWGMASRFAPLEFADGKRFTKLVRNPETGRTRTVRYGQAGKAKDGGDRIRPGTSKGDAYCARSNAIQGNWRSDPNSPNNLSRRKWKCRGDVSMK